MLSSKVGPYKIINMIGEGCFASVYQGELHGHPYAIKAVHRKLLDDYSVLKAFERETRIYMKMPYHPNIVKAIEVIPTTENICIVEEFCSNGDLESALFRNFSLVRKNIAKISQGLLSALLFIQDRHMAHRDIKPENILLDENYTAKLADFGLCCETSNGNLSETICGTPFYSAPEVTHGSYDPMKSDIWSLGVIIFQMATGSLPWRSINLPTLQKEKENSKTLFIPPGIHPEIADVIRRCIETDVEKRASLEELSSLPFFISMKKTNLALDQVSTHFTKRNSLRVLTRKRQYAQPMSPPTQCLLTGRLIALS